MGKVFSRIESPTICWQRRSSSSMLKEWEPSRTSLSDGPCPFPDSRNLEGMVSGEVKSGYPILISEVHGPILFCAKEETPSQPPAPIPREEATRTSSLSVKWLVGEIVCPHHIEVIRPRKRIQQKLLITGPSSLFQFIVAFGPFSSKSPILIAALSCFSTIRQ